MFVIQIGIYSSSYLYQIQKNKTTNKLFIIICLEMLIFSCSSIYKNSSNGNSEIQEERCDSLLLSETESAYLNKIFDSTRKDFDFTNKKVGFIKISGESGKVHYFNMQEKHSVDEAYPCDNGTLYIFNATQKEESGGYDAAIVYWSKFLLSVDDVMKRMQKK